jgi:hypothetical protein
MKDIIIKTIKKHINEFPIGHKISVEDIMKFCDGVTKEFKELYMFSCIDNIVEVVATLHKWIDCEDGSIEMRDVDDWDDAEQLTIIMRIERPRARKDKDSHEDIIDDCMLRLLSIVPTNNFEKIENEGVSQYHNSRCYESVGFLNFYKETYYTNHKKFWGISE